VTDTPDITNRQFLAGLFVILLVAVTLRGAFPTADPPWRAPVGITWHDEGPWVHNARNKALWGEWSTDRWNPMYLAPVFTALEYAAFESFGVGQWQARVVSMGMGTLAILFVALGVGASASRRAALIAAALLAVDHVWVQWNRVALLETTMVSFIAISWAAYALAERHRAWGALAGVAAWLAFFSKASAAFYLAALGLDAAATVVLAMRARDNPDQRRRGIAAGWTLAGLAVAAALFLCFFAIPHWSEVRFYNWQMSVTRKPGYGAGDLISRASWVPAVNDFFLAQLPVTFVGLAAALGLAWRWRTARPAERLLALGVGLGLLEIIVHDAGNERRLLIFIPLLVALAAPILAGDRRLVPIDSAGRPRRLAAVMVPCVLYAAYLICGALARVVFAPGVRPTVWAGAIAAVAMTAYLYAQWPRVGGWLAHGRLPAPAMTALVLAIVAADLVQYGRWAAERTYKNVTASMLVGQWLPPGTIVEGKLANGLALDNRIRPLFVGHGFGNYENRMRSDVRYILTYTSPRLGYEGSVILDVLDANRGWKAIHEFDVAETPGGHDRAALIEKP
jgi:4-amino-4-deoxy-L-arabinose transferase-like glycosyltransferase